VLVALVHAQQQVARGRHIKAHRVVAQLPGLAQRQVPVSANSAAVLPKTRRAWPLLLGEKAGLREVVELMGRLLLLSGLIHFLKPFCPKVV
jgi:hypothetical protein